MNWVDITLLAVLVLSIVLGLWRGLVYEVLSVAGWVVAFIAAQRYASDMAQILPLEGFSPALKIAAGFILIFVGVAFAAGLLSWLVKKLVASVGLRPVDRVLGAVFGLARGALILLAVATVVSMTPLRTDPAWVGSPVASGLSQSLAAIKPVLPVAVGQYLP